MLKKTIAAVCLMMCSMGSQAGLIESHGFSRDDRSVLVTGQGLEWLTWDKTAGMSIRAALAIYAPDGWMLASNGQMAALFSQFQFGKTDWSTHESAEQQAYQTWDSEEGGKHRQFIDLFGATSTSSCGLGQLQYCYPAEDAYYQAMAWYGTDQNNNGLYNLANVHDDFSYVASANDVSRWDAFAGLSGDYTSIDAVHPWAGVALVRQVGHLPTVPSPTTVSLLLFAMVGLALHRRASL